MTRISRSGSSALAIAGALLLPLPSRAQDRSDSLPVDTLLFELDRMVVSASRTPEKITEAPATITRVGSEELDLTMVGSYLDALRHVKGLITSQVGVANITLNARGFGSAVPQRMLFLEDNRISALPDWVNASPAVLTTPRIDVASVEVITGPGAALYGADASNGVVSVETRDPRDFPGTTLEVIGGSRDYADVQFRHAGVRGAFGYKIVGEYFTVDDFEENLTYFGSWNEDEVLDWQQQALRTRGALAWYGDDLAIELAAGYNQTDGVWQTAVGRNLYDDWHYGFIQLEATRGRWYANFYRSQSSVQEHIHMFGYAMQRINSDRNSLGLSHDSIVALADFPGSTELHAAELQHRWTLRLPLEPLLVWGVQYRHDRIDSDRQWLTDQITGRDITFDVASAYAQLDVALTPRLSAVLAARYDEHSEYDDQFSPKGGILLEVAEGHSTRLTWNRAYRGPTPFMRHFMLPSASPGNAALPKHTRIHRTR